MLGLIATQVLRKSALYWKLWRSSVYVYSERSIFVLGSAVAILVSSDTFTVLL